AGYLHGHASRDTTAFHVPHRAAPQIMKQQSWHSCSATGGAPRLPELHDARTGAAPLQPQIRKDEGGDASEFLLVPVFSMGPFTLVLPRYALIDLSHARAAAAALRRLPATAGRPSRPEGRRNAWPTTRSD